jgi:DNA-binding transcriptional ArsR family regulator
MDVVEPVRFEDARRILGLLAEPARLRVVAAVVLGYTTTDDIARVAGLNHKEVRRALARLVAGGLVIQEQGVNRIDVEEVRAAARRVAEADPEDTLDASPASARVLRSFLKDGRLSGIPATRSKRLVVLTTSPRASSRDVDTESQR